MELQELYSEIRSYIDVPYLVCFMCITYGLKDALVEVITTLTKKEDSKLLRHLSVFLIATLVAVPFWFFFNHSHMELFVSYCVGTTFHELGVNTIKSIINTFSKKTKTRR